MTRVEGLTETRDAFRFRLRGGDAQALQRAVATLKTTVPFPLRAWDSETRWWTVTKTPQTERVLCAGLPGFAAALTTSRQQLGLFDDDMED